MRVAITGASGFLGSRLAQHLASLGHDVLKIQSPGQKAARKNNEQALDLEDQSNLPRLVQLLKQVEVCYFLAARKHPSHPGLLLQQNRQIDNLCATAWLESKCHQAVYVSGQAILGSAQPGPITEESIPKPTCEYHSAKKAGEDIMQNAAREGGDSLFILRVNAPYGPGMDTNAVVAKFLKQAILGREITVFGDGSRQQHFTWVYDFCRAAELILDQQPGLYHFCGPDRVSMNQLARLCIEITQSESNLGTTGDDSGASAPILGPDRFETLWPRHKRTTLREGLSHMAAGIKEA